MSSNRNTIPPDKESARSTGPAPTDPKLKAAQREIRMRVRPQTPETQAGSQSQMENDDAETEQPPRNRETMARSLDGPSTRGDVYKLFMHLEAHIQEIANFLQVPQRVKAQGSQAGNQQGRQPAQPPTHQQVPQSQPQVQPQPLTRPQAQYLPGPQLNLPMLGDLSYQQLQLQLQMLCQMQFQIQQNQLHLAQLSSSLAQYGYPAELLHSINDRNQALQHPDPARSIGNNPPQQHQTGTGTYERINSDKHQVTLKIPRGMASYINAQLPREEQDPQNQNQGPSLPPISNFSTRNKVEEASGNGVRTTLITGEKDITNGGLTEFEMLQRCQAIRIPGTDFQLRTATFLESALNDPKGTTHLSAVNHKKPRAMETIPTHSDPARQSSSGSQPSSADKPEAVNARKKGSLAPVPGTEGWGPI